MSMKTRSIWIDLALDFIKINSKHKKNERSWRNEYKTRSIWIDHTLDFLKII